MDASGGKDGTSDKNKQSKNGEVIFFLGLFVYQMLCSVMQLSQLMFHDYVEVFEERMALIPRNETIKNRRDSVDV